MIEQKQRHLDVTMCHRCLMRENADVAPLETFDEAEARLAETWLDDGAYAVIPEMAPQICQILSIGQKSMRFVYFSKKPFAKGSLSSAEVVVTGQGFIADSIPFKVLQDITFDDEVIESDEDIKRVCEVEILTIGEATEAQIDHVIALKGRPLQ